MEPTATHNDPPKARVKRRGGTRRANPEYQSSKHGARAAPDPNPNPNPEPTPLAPPPEAARVRSALIGGDHRSRGAAQSRVVYSSDGWEITVDNTDPIGANEMGPFLGNGKLGMFAAFDRMDVQKTLMTAEFTYDRGMYRTNTLEVFRALGCKLFSANDEDVTLAFQQQRLNMDVGVVNTTFSMQHNATGALATVDYEVFAVRQLPFTSIAVISITPQSGDFSELLFFNEPSAPAHLRNPTFNNSLVANDGNGDSTYILNGVADTATGSQIAFANTLMVEPASTELENLGFNTFRFDPQRCINKYRFKNMVLGQTVTLYVVSTQLSSFDFTAPLEECKRIALSVVARPNAMAAIRQAHVREWTTLWETNIHIEKKVLVTTSESEAVRKLQQHLRYSLYNIYASVRENVNSEVNPLNLSIMDIHGKSLLDGDLWLLPVLTLLKPKAARTLLEYRYNTLQSAVQLAAGYGYEGSKYPYVNDVLGYKNALYWDTMSSVHTFNTAVVSIHVWNYYRITRDTEWLRTKGFAILRGNADFFVSLCEADEDGTLHIANMAGLSSRVSERDHAMTNMLILLALKYAIEASHELAYFVKEAWTHTYGALVVPFYPDPDFDILKFDAAATGAEVHDLLDPLVLLLPLYNTLIFNKELYCQGISNVEVTRRNLDFYTDPNRWSADTRTHPINLALAAILSARVAQNVPSYIDAFETQVNMFLSTSTTGIYGNFKPYGMDSGLNDITMNALFILMIVLSVCGLQIKGGVAETRFTYEEFKIQHAAAALMPAHWKQVKLTGFGSKKETFLSVNQTLYTPPSSSG